MSTYVTALYRPKEAGDTDVAIKVTDSACWLRGLVYYCDEEVESGLQKQTLELHNGDNVDVTEVHIPIAAHETMTQVFLPENSYMDFDNGIYISSQRNRIIDNIFLTFFLTI